MKNFLPAVLAGLVAVALASPALAQDADRVWEQGSIWSVSQVETKPGQFNKYIKNLSENWRRYLDEQKKDGHVLSYRILSVDSPRDGEANLVLLVEFKDWAAYGTGVEYFEKLAERLQGSVQNASQSNIDREALRTLRGGITAQEIRFKDK